MTSSEGGLFPWWNSPLRSMIAVAVISATAIREREIAPEIADRRSVLRNVGIVVRRLRVWQIVAAPSRELGKIPVPFDEFYDRGMIGIFMRHVSSLRIFGHDQHRDAGSVPEIVDRLHVTGVVIAA